MKKAKLLIKILILSMLIILIFFGLKENHVQSIDTIFIGNKGINSATELADTGYSTPYEFMLTPVNNLLWKVLYRNNTSNTDYDGAAAKPNGLCLYHRKADGSTDSYYDIVNVFDFRYRADSNGVYHYCIKKDSDNNDNYAFKGKTAGKLVYSMWNTYNKKTTGYAGPAKNSTYASFFAAVDDGTIVPSNSFLKSGNTPNKKFNDELFSISQEATEHANKTEGYVKLTKVNTTPELNVSGNNYIFGPFNIKYANKGIESITIKGNSTTTLNNSISWSTDKIHWNNNKKLPNNQKFYLKVSSATNLAYNSYSVTFKQQELEFYKARLVLLHGRSNEDQQTGVFAVVSDKVQGEVSYTVNRNVSMTIVKKDTSSNKKLNGAVFKIRTGIKDDTHFYWLGKNSDGTYNYESSFTNAEQFVVNGEKTISGLRCKEYRIIEVKPPDGYGLNTQAKYEKEHNWVNAAFVAKSDFDNNNKKTVEIKNRLINLVINKTDADTGKKLNEVEFKIRTKWSENASEQRWLKKNSDGTYNYNATSASSATTFKTSNGKIIINGLKHQNYGVIETKTIDGYDIKKQDGYNAPSGGVVYKALVSECNKDNTITINAENKKGQQEKGTLIINKVDKKTRAKLEAVFTVKNSKNQYVNGKPGGPYTFGYLKANGKYTSTGGKITLSNLPVGKYTITEITPPNGYKPASGEKTCTVTKNGSVSVTFENEKDNGDKTPEIQVIKLDSDKSETRVQGATFALDRYTYSYTMYYQRIYRYKVTKGYSPEQRDKNGKIIKEAEYAELTLDKDEGWTSQRYRYNEYSPADTKYMKEGEYAYRYILDSDKDHEPENIFEWKTIKTATTNSKGEANLGTYDNSFQRKPYDTYTRYRVRETVIPDSYYSGGKNQEFTINKEDINNKKKVTLYFENKKNILEVTKRDVDTNALISGVTFELYDENGDIVNLVYNSYDNSYNYSETGTITRVNTESGKVKYGRLPPGTYTVKEVKTLDNYEIYTLNSREEPYDGEKQGTTATTQVSRGTNQMTIYNKKKLSIKGTAWIDKGQVRKSETTYNSLYDEGEEKIGDITVKLKEKNGTTIATTTTDGSGNYEFTNKVDRYKADNYYVEFDYSKTSYKTTHIPVEYKEDFNGSKAIANSLPVKDASLTGIATTYINTPSGMDNVYGLSGYFDNGDGYLYNESTNSIDGINLGIRPLEDPSFSIAQDIAYVKIDFDGNKYKYVYGGTNSTIVSDSPLVNWQSKNNGARYSRDIYPSDIAANIESAGRLKAYVVYRISIKNTIYTDNEIYKEKKLIIERLIENFDNSYELSTDVDSEFDQQTRSDFSNWTASGSTATYNINNASNNLKAGLEPGQTQDIYIQFKVKNDALNQILTGKKSTELPVEAESTSHHEYTRRDYGWDYGIKKENNNHETKQHDAKAEAPGMVFKVSDLQRTLSGIVFKDSRDTSRNEELVGNGRYENPNEETIENVKVELLDSSKNVTTLYPTTKTIINTINSAEDVQATKKVATTTTNVGGEYEFKGIIPGKYIVRFTYGDGTTRYEAINYKSTIITLDSAKKALLSSDPHNGEWYKYLYANENTTLNEHNYSVAGDDLNTRAKINDGEDIKSISADTPLALITLENTVKKEVNAANVNISRDSYGNIRVNENGELIRTINNINSSASKFSDFNFGIIEMPEITGELDKVISNIMLVNNQGNVVFNGNPQNANMAGVVDLDFEDTNNGSKNTKVEIASDLIFGSKLYITYELRMKNTSKYANYIEIDGSRPGEGHYGEYYLVGTRGSYSRQIQLNIDEMIDYLDPTVKYIKGENERINITQTKKNKQELLNIVGIGKIQRNKNGVLTITTERELAAQDDDMEIKNKIEIVKATRTIDDMPDGITQENIEEKSSIKIVKMPEKIQPSEARTIVTPPTGENKQLIIIYSVTGIMAFAIIATGIIIIKKKIL